MTTLVFMATFSPAAITESYLTLEMWAGWESVCSSWPNPKISKNCNTTSIDSNTNKHRYLFFLVHLNPHISVSCQCVCIGLRAVYLISLQSKLPLLEWHLPWLFICAMQPDPLQKPPLRTEAEAAFGCLLVLRLFLETKRVCSLSPSVSVSLLSCHHLPSPFRVVSSPAWGRQTWSQLLQHLKFDRSDRRCRQSDSYVAENLDQVLRFARQGRVLEWNSHYYQWRVEMNEDRDVGINILWEILLTFVSPHRQQEHSVWYEW